MLFLQKKTNIEVLQMGYKDKKYLSVQNSVLTN